MQKRRLSLGPVAGAAPATHASNAAWRVDDRAWCHDDEAEGDEIFAVDGVALEPGARLGEVLERREMHHFVVRREPNALERGKARRLSSY